MSRRARSGKIVSKNDYLIRLLIKDLNYRVHSDGRIENLYKGREWRIITNKRKQGRIQIKYFCIKLKKRVNLLVHRIIWAAFGDTPLAKDLVISHKNDEAHQNNIENLESVPVAINNLRAFQNGRKASYNKAKITHEEADEIRSSYNSGENYSKLSEKWGLTRGSVTAIIKGLTWYQKQTVFCLCRSTNFKISKPV